MVVSPPKSMMPKSLPAEEARSGPSTAALLATLEELTTLLLADWDIDPILQWLTTAGARLVGSRMNTALLVDAEQHCLVHAAATGLPAEFVDLAQRFPIGGPLAGCCGTCAATGKVTIVEDTLSHPLTAPYRGLAERFGLRAVWSVPLLGRNGSVLGVFGTYYPQSYHPTAEQVGIMQALARHTALVLETARLVRHSQRQAQELAEAKMLLDVAFAQMQEGVAIANAQGEVLQLNPAGQQILGIGEPQPFPPETWPDVFTLRDLNDRQLDAEEVPFTKALRGKTVRDEVIRYRRPDGLDIELLVQAQPLQAEGGSSLGAMTVFRDVTAERRLQQEREVLRRLAERLTAVDSPREIAEAAFTAVAELFGPDQFHIELYDPSTDRLETLLLLDRDETGQLREYPMEGDRPCEPLRSVLRGKPLLINRLAGDERMDLPLFGAQRRSRALAFLPIRREHGVVGIFGLKCHSHPRRYTEADLPMLQEMADLLGPPLANARLRLELGDRQAADARRERLRALGQMAAGVAHNFNNALTSVLGYADLLCMTPGMDADVREMLEQIRSSSLQAAGVVERLTRFYRPRDRNLDMIPVDLPKLVQEVIETTRPHWSDLPSKHGAVIAIKTDLPPMPLVLGHLQELQDVVTNLLFNAVAAMPKGGTITLRTERGNDQVILTVADTGIGMPPDLVEHCFEPFYRSKLARGSGLGLAIVHGTITRHGGQVRVTSEFGQGSTFTIQLPIHQAPQPATEIGTGENIPSARPCWRILLIDDEPAVRGVVDSMLKTRGHLVTTAAGGAEGIQLLESQPFDLVLTDLGMPGMDGRQVARAVKSRSPATPVILLTGWGQALGSLESEPIERVLQKPIGVQDLLAAIDRVMLARSSG